MGEDVYAHINIKVPKRWRRQSPPDDDGYRDEADDLPTVVANVIHYLDEYGGHEDIGDDAIVVNACGWANYGFNGSSMRELVLELETLRIPYEGGSEGSSEGPPICHFYDGNAEGAVRTGVGDADQMFLTEGIWKAIRDGVHDWADSIERYFAWAKVEDFDISHLLDAPHPDDEDAINEAEATL